MLVICNGPQCRGIIMVPDLINILAFMFKSVKYNQMPHHWLWRATPNGYNLHKFFWTSNSNINSTFQVLKIVTSGQQMVFQHFTYWTSIFADAAWRIKIQIRRLFEWITSFSFIRLRLPGNHILFFSLSSFIMKALQKIQKTIKICKTRKLMILLLFQYPRISSFVWSYDRS